MPNTIAVLNIADAKASPQRAAMSTTGYAYADEDKIQFDSSFGNHRMSNNNLREDRKCLRLYPGIFKKSSNYPQQNLTIDGIDILGLTING